MSPRTIRRAIERKAKKLESKRLLANHANAQLFTGPTSEEGKAKSCLNAPDEAAVLSKPKTQAIITALTGRTVLLPADDAPAYERHLAAFEDEYKPAGLRERELVQSIADTFWRLARIPALEMALFAKGRIEFAELFEDHEPAARPLLIDAHTFITYEKQIRNLQLQEARLVRRREKETAELRALQQERKQRELQEMDSAAKHDGQPSGLAANGFEFSTQAVEHFLRPGCQDRAATIGSGRSY